MWPDENGDWGTGDSYNEPRTDSTVWGDVAGAGQGIDNSGTGSDWGGFFSNAFKTLVTYGLQKDAAQSAAEIERQRLLSLTQASTATAAAQNAGTIAGIPKGLLLIGALGLAAVLVLRKV